jgi:hypothetical protein
MEQLSAEPFNFEEVTKRRLLEFVTGASGIYLVGTHDFVVRENWVPRAQTWVLVIEEYYPLRGTTEPIRIPHSWLLEEPRFENGFIGKIQMEMWNLFQRKAADEIQAVKEMHRLRADNVVSIFSKTA